MYSYAGRLRAVELYIRLGKRLNATIRQLVMLSVLDGPVSCTSVSVTVRGMSSRLAKPLA
ncbi:hypothetical protein A6U87_06065 [Rhizobium sp. AC44/96]|uniref:hypothetical protein n=1 Tax=unclassified Rhizobium TaxID=2613769 RepID=UPI00080FB4F5|nr:MULTISPECIES: hypothetical protein [unclassified Rhizobium]MDM9623265.1 hypothetical protein [Rhizobium sp. S96]OCJ12872.1 hypothetical protein A6U87_06065 [Rhizobium sp. AC44/96]